MILEIDEKVTHQKRKTPLIQQTAYWSEVKRQQGISSLAVDIKAKAEDLFTEPATQKIVSDDLLILLQHIDSEHQVAYVPYGPNIEPSEENQGRFLEQLSEKLREVLPEKCIMVRYDLHWQSHWAKDKDYYNEDGHFEGPPARQNQEFRFNFNTDNWNLRKANSDILPSNTIFIDLRKSEEELLRGMKSKTRYNIKLAKKRGVMVRKAAANELHIWNDLYQDTTNRNGIFLDDIDYFKSVLENNSKNTHSPAEVELLIAEKDGTPLAAMFLVMSGGRATYLFGASSSENRNLMATYAMQWEAMKRAKAKGCTQYDMFGIAPKPDPSHPMYGLYKFKTGFGGRIFHRMGCWDYPLDHEKYKLYQATELNGQGYHLN
ncbi:MAG: peptidoglycan bridge formation glycyltransferase FemA/FemB family protein [Hymenobacteraceae bacterium]|nr:peptidoglycan bridge formation glycyltransferase FemA/FemB family protein [Hymenobacteraceae bacterium]MDX5397664.1 peptidoglycan bridge formation glycyltransferase FemA/FemB family protein [Hymenobacteraceae bacterium]MDX5513740.1 peptidoglycan bridge formation glycyltransferase FemA/FemB family protein [Hymenobacteraceae bacterium]